MIRVLEHDPEKGVVVFGKDHARTREHDPEKCAVVFGKDHAKIKELERGDLETPEETIAL